MNTVNGIDIEAPWSSKQPLQRARGQSTASCDTKDALSPPT